MEKFFSKRKQSFQYAFSGINHILRTQKNSWIHLFFTGAVIFLTIWLKLSYLDTAILLLCITGVWVTECLNTSIETILDLVQPDRHPLVRIAKDVAAGAVLIAAIGSAVIGLLLLAPPLFKKILLWF